MPKTPKRPPPPRTGRPSTEEAAQLPGRLLDAAQAVFVEKGYARATVEDIAKAAGTSRKTVYTRYANKDEILAAVIDRILEAALPPPAVQPAPQPIPADAGAALRKIASEAAELSSRTEVAGLNRLIMAEAAQTPALADMFIDLHARAAASVGAHLEALRERGDLPLMPDTTLAATIFIEMAASLPRLRAVLGLPMTRKQQDALIAAAVEIFLRGCGGDGGRQRTASRESSS